MPLLQKQVAENNKVRLNKKSESCLETTTYLTNICIKDAAKVRNVLITYLLVVID